MQLVERHIIKPNHKYYQEADLLCKLPKNLYNCTNYIDRQNFFQGVLTNPVEVYHQLKTSSDYKAIPAKVSQNIFRLVFRSWSPSGAGSWTKITSVPKL